MRLLDRYVLRNFLEPFLLCFLAFLGILLIFDVNDNLNDFLTGKERWGLIAVYYSHQLPHFILLCIPIGLLLANLYCLSKMSRSNEIISMLTAGRSVLRIVFPLFAAAALITGFCIWLNYELAPQADAVRKKDMDRIRFGENKAADGRLVTETLDTLTSHLMKDRMTNRVWFATSMQPNVNMLDAVHITELDADGAPKTRWYARDASYDPRIRKWSLAQGRQVTFDKEGNVEGDMDDWTKLAGASGTRTFGWEETPYRIASSRMEAEQLSVPELREYLASNADFPDAQLAPFRTHLQYRWALPFTCLAVVFIAAPLGIVFSRRAVLASVASSIFIFFTFLFCMFFFLALGKGNHLPPIAAAWIPNALLVLTGSYLLYLRSTNREAPKLFSRK